MRKKGILASAVAVFYAVSTLCTPVFAASDVIKVKSVQISAESATVRVNQTRTLSAYVLPLDADDQIINWESSNPEIVDVDGDGTITGISPGTAEVTAMAANNRSAVCVVTVPGTVLKSIPQDTENKDRSEAYADGGEVLSAATLRVKVEEALKDAKNETVTVAFQDKTAVSTAALRAASFTAEYEGGKVLLKFITPQKGQEDDAGSLFSSGQPATSAAQGWIILDPAQAGDEDHTIGLAVYTGSDKTQATRTKLEAVFDGRIEIIQLSHQGSFGMPVEIAAKADLSGLDTGNLKFYRYDSAENTYTALTGQTYQLDEAGYLHFSASQGGAYMITN